MFLPKLISLLPLVSLASSTSVIKRQSGGYPAPICTGDCQNQVHDPSVVLRGDGIYFRFSTLDLITIATAPSIDGPWQIVGSVLDQPSIINLPGNDVLWAADCFFHDGTYYLYYSVSESGSQNSDIGVATSPNMEPGSWTDHGSIGIPYSDRYNRIDPNLFQYNPSAPFYMNFGSFWEDIFQVPMANPPLTIQGEIVHLEQNVTARPNDLPSGPSEGPFMFWLDLDGQEYYYLFFSSGNCCNEPGTEQGLAPPGEEYKIMVCRSDNPNGGFVDKNGVDCLQNGGSLVLASHDDVYAPGGQGVMRDPVQGLVVYYHYVKPSVGYAYEQFFFGYNKLDFSSGWPVVVA